MRQCRIIDSRTPSNIISKAVAATTYTQLLSELRGSYSGMSATVVEEGGSSPRPVSGNDVLPTSAFKIFFVPEKQKSGN